MKKLIIIGLMMILILPTITGEEWTRPPTTGGTNTDYCVGGVCSGSLHVPGNLTVDGTYVNITTINFNITGNVNVTQNVTALYFFGDGSHLTGIANASGWNHSGNITNTEDYEDHVGIGTNNPVLAHQWSNNLVIQQRGTNGGMSIRTDDTDNGVIDFSDCDTGGSCSYRGYIVYDHSQDRMELGAESSDMIWLDHPEREVRIIDNLLVVKNTTLQGNLSVFQDANFSSNIKVEGIIYGGNTELVGNLNVSKGSINVTNNVTAHYFIGNGSQLTDIGNYFNRSGTDLYPANIADQLGLGVTNPNTMLDIYTTDFLLAEFTGSGFDCHAISIDADMGKDVMIMFDQATAPYWTVGMEGTTRSFNWRRLTFGAGCLEPSVDSVAMRLSQDANLTVNQSLTAFGIIKLNRTIFTTDDGNVGIGTTAPSQKLDVEGIITINDNAAGDKIYLYSTTYSIGIGSGKIIYDVPTGSRHAMRVNDVEIASITGTGLGIGTTTPQQELTVIGHANVTGNFTGNQIYGEIWNYSSNASSWTFAITNSGVYYNLTGLGEGNLNGFTFTDANQANGGSYLTAQVAGIYKVDLSISFESSAAGGLYGMAVVENFNVNNHRDCYARRVGTGSAGNVGITCLVCLDVGSTINIQIEDEIAPSKNINIHTANLNLVRVGS